MAYTKYHDPWHNADAATGGGDESTPISAAALDWIEDGIAAAAATADAAIPKAISGVATDKVPVYNGSAWVAQKVVDAQIDAAAAISVSKLAAGATGTVLASSASTAQWLYPPGYQIASVSMTAEKSVTATAQSAGDLVMTLGSVTFDGTQCLFEYYFPYATASPTAGRLLWVMLYESGVYVTRLAIVTAPVTTTAIYSTISGAFFRTPSAGSHTYQLYGYSSAGTGLLGAGTGSGADTYMPAFFRVVKV